MGEANRYRVAPVMPSDYETIQRLLSQPGRQSPRFMDPPPGLPGPFVELLWRDVYVQYLVSRYATGEPLALIAATRADLLNRTVYLWSDPISSQSRDVDFEFAWTWLANHLHTNFAFRKMYVEIVGARDGPPHLPGLSDGWTLSSCGRIPGYYLRGNDEVDLHTFCLAQVE